MENRLVELNQKDLRILQDLYATKANSYIGYMTISNYIRWFEQDENLKAKVLCLNGDYLDGTFVVIVGVTH